MRIVLPLTKRELLCEVVIADRSLLNKQRFKALMNGFFTNQVLSF